MMRCKETKVVNFKVFLRPYGEIKYFSRTLTEFKDFSRFYEPWFGKHKKNVLMFVLIHFFPLSKPCERFCLYTLSSRLRCFFLKIEFDR